MYGAGVIYGRRCHLCVTSLLHHRDAALRAPNTSMKSSTAVPSGIATRVEHMAIEIVTSIPHSLCHPTQPAHSVALLHECDDRDDIYGIYASRVIYARSPSLRVRFATSFACR